MAIAPVNGPAQSFGLDFQSLLKIILTELQYQDPLKPMDNFQFVSQLSQFAQLQQGQNLSDRLDQLLVTEANVYVVGIIGKTVEVNQGQSALSGTVQSVSFAGRQPQVTVRTANGQIITGISLADISVVR